MEWLIVQVREDGVTDVIDLARTEDEALEFIESLDPRGELGLSVTQRLTIADTALVPA